MRLLLCLFLSFYLVASDDVLVLTTGDFDNAISENKLILVEFYAPWCGHCKKLEPAFSAAAATLKGEVALAKVDATVETELGTRFGVRGYPTLKFFKNGVPKEYGGPRDAEGIVAWLRKQQGPSVTVLSTAEEVTAFSTKERVVVVGFFENTEGEDYKVYAEVADELRDAFVFGAAIGKELGGNVPSVVVYKKFDEGKAELTDIQLDTLVEFINTESLPLIDQIGPENYSKYIETGLPLLFLFVNGKEDNTALFDTFRTYASKVKGEVNFCWIDTNKFAAQAGRLGLPGKVFPSVAIDDHASGQHYAYPEGPLTDIEKWIDEFVAGSLAPTIKSEEIPETNDGPVYVVVAKSFQDVVVNSNKDVFLEFYAPWCGHCKNLAPIFDQLGTEFKGVESVLIAKIDASNNDVDAKYGIRGFPTLKFFPNGAKDTPIDYDGERTLEAMSNFVKSHTSVPVETAPKEAVKEGLKDEL